MFLDDELSLSISHAIFHLTIISQSDDKLTVQLFMGTFEMKVATQIY